MSKVSIITSFFNGSKYFNETFSSVVNQSFKSFEWIIVDDGSDPDEKLYLKHLVEKDERIRLFELDQNSGAGAARNLGIRNAVGRFITFIDSDDVWELNRIEKHLSYMVHNNAVFSHSSYGYITSDGRILSKTLIVSSKPVNYYGLLRRTEISCLTAIYDAKVLGKQYMSLDRRKQDYALWLKILSLGYTSLPFKEITAYYRQHEDSATSKKWKLFFKHYVFLRKSQNLSIIESSYFTFIWAINGVFRYYIK